MNGLDPIIDLVSAEIIDLVARPEPTMADVMRSPAVRHAATRALRDLDEHHDLGPWVAVCTDTAEVVATSPSLDPDAVHALQAEFDAGMRWDCDRVPMVVIGLGDIRSVSRGEPAYAAAEIVVRSLSEIVIAEHRVAVATARAEQAEALAATDALTGLGNQRAWWERIAEEDARIQRSDASAVIAVIDLDGLKTVNDEQGHLHGDLLLRVAALTLRDAVRSCDHLARVGGDEFAVLAVDYDGQPEVLLERIRMALDKAEIAASIGVAPLVSGSTLIEAYARADEAMYGDNRRRRPRVTGTDG
jgi:diguanylate cyclase (GGDEF)-like protein